MTTESKNWISPRSGPGAILSAFAVHALVYGGIFFLLRLGTPDTRSQQPGEVDLSYQVLTEPPAPVKVVHRVVRAKEPDQPVDTKVKPMAPTPHELQDTQGAVAGTQAAAKPTVAPGADTAGDALATPYYKIKPKYPRAALASGTEGWVMLKVDITEKGEVENVSVVDGIQRSLFELEAKRAVEKWKYKPFTGPDGKPLRKAGHLVRVDFKLNEA